MENRKLKNTINCSHGYKCVPARASSILVHVKALPRSASIFASSVDRGKKSRQSNSASCKWFLTKGAPSV